MSGMTTCKWSTSEVVPPRSDRRARRGPCTGSPYRDTSRRSTHDDQAGSNTSDHVTVPVRLVLLCLLAAGCATDGGAPEKVADPCPSITATAERIAGEARQAKNEADVARSEADTYRVGVDNVDDVNHDGKIDIHDVTEATVPPQFDEARSREEAAQAKASERAATALRIIADNSQCFSAEEVAQARNLLDHVAR
jgi:hypothetical protein